ncbi:MAG: TetR/AcrR family transcriptional regulator [Anaerovoracaceae bacterium]
MNTQIKVKNGNDMTTKEKILEVSLKLFAEKGYSSVYVGEIAQAVGIKAPSLYKHYKNKQEIFDSCIKVFYERMQKMTGGFSLLESNITEVSPNDFTVEIFLEVTKSVLLFHLKDEVASSLRKMLTIERYGDPRLNNLYEELFLDEPIRYETGLFSQMMEIGVMKKANPKLLAYKYYSPIFLLLTKYDMHLCDEQEALAELELVAKDFYEMYRNKNI